jgi:hypothetical protein
MKKILLILAFLVPFVLAGAQNTRGVPEKKIHVKEIPPSRLPGRVTSYISANLPNGKIKKATKQKHEPEAKFVVIVVIKDKRHTLVFNKSGYLVKLDGKKVYTAPAKDQ